MTQEINQDRKRKMYSSSDNSSRRDISLSELGDMKVVQLLRVLKPR